MMHRNITRCNRNFVVLIQLKFHPLSGKLAGVQAVSLTYSYWLTLLLKVTEQESVPLR